MPKGFRFTAFFALVIFGAFAAGPVHGADDLGPDGRLCRLQTERQGRLARLPKDLLTAVSLVESGRWDAGRQAKVAWPWTVTANGEGKFFPTKEAAVAEVRRLRAHGVRSIDVGCMQINLFYHPNAFPDLQTAFDPAANVAYAVEFLTALHGETGSWTAAATRYHSATPVHARRYQARVLEEWRALKTHRSPRQPSTVALAQSVESQDRERRAALAEQRRKEAEARAFAEAWRAERLAAYRRAKNGKDRESRTADAS